MSTYRSQYGKPAQRSAQDFYETPPEAVHALLKAGFVPIGKIWEPACGNGAISRVLEVEGFEVVSTDLYPYDYTSGQPGLDFLETKEPLGSTIITNPPYNIALDFILHAIRLGVPLIAILCRLDFLGSGRRYERLFRRHPPAAVLVFSWRLPFVIEGRARRMVSYAWYLWTGDGKTELKWLHR